MSSTTKIQKMQKGSAQRLETALQELFAVAGDDNVSMTAWAEHAGLSRNTIWRLATRRTWLPRFDTLCRMAAAVDVEISLEPKR